MKQNIVVKVQMNCGKCRSQALQIAAAVNGVSEVKIEGEEKDQVAVIGEDVDSVCLTHALKKKLGYATLVSVVVLDEPPAATEVEEKNDKQDKVENNDTHQYLYPYPYSYRWYPCPQLYYTSEIVYDPNYSFM